MGKYGNTKASRVMEAQDRENDLIQELAAHLGEHPMSDPVMQLQALLMLKKLDRRQR